MGEEETPQPSPNDAGKQLNIEGVFSIEEVRPTIDQSGKARPTGALVSSRRLERMTLETAVGWFGFDENRALSLA